jgi:hypothetical protein
MLRLLLILSLIFYVLYKLGLFRVFVQQANNGYRDASKPRDGNVTVEPPTPRSPKKPSLKGGDYIDYEEVK